MSITKGGFAINGRKIEKTSCRRDWDIACQKGAQMAPKMQSRPHALAVKTRQT